MAELVTTAGVTAALCSTVFERMFGHSHYDPNHHHGGGFRSFSRTTTVTRNPPSVDRQQQQQQVGSSPGSGSGWDQGLEQSPYTYFEAEPRANQQQQQQPSNGSVAPEFVKNEDGIRITRGGGVSGGGTVPLPAGSVLGTQQQASPFYPNPGDSTTSGSIGTANGAFQSPPGPGVVRSWSGGGSFGGAADPNYSSDQNHSPHGVVPAGGIPPSSIFGSLLGGANSPLFNAGLPGGQPAAEGTIVTENPDGSTTTTTTTHSSGGFPGQERFNQPMSSSQWWSNKFYYYGLIPAMAMWRTHRISLSQAALLAQQHNMWRNAFILGTLVPLQTVYAVCLFSTLVDWTGKLFSSSPSTIPSASTTSALGYKPEDFGLPIDRSMHHSPYDPLHTDNYSGGAGAGGIRLKMENASWWVFRKMSYAVWSLAIWPGLVFGATSILTVPIGVVAARIAFGVRAKNAFSAGISSSPFR